LVPQRLSSRRQSLVFSRGAAIAPPARIAVRHTQLRSL
jgi:hypothetical protein